MPLDTGIPRLKIAVIGAGISGLSAAWLLNHDHDVTLYEALPRLGGHSHTVDAPGPRGAIPVDTGFIVYNSLNYPNLTAMFDYLGVATQASNMGFAVSLDQGRVEYGGDSLVALFSQWRNLVKPRFWSMLADLARFYREAPGHIDALDGEETSLGDYLDAHGYGAAFQDDHLLPQAGAIWSASPSDIRDFPAAAFIRFCDNHGLLKITDRPQWRTVTGGSRAYVAKLTAPLAGRIRAGSAVTRVARTPAGVAVRSNGETRLFDHVLIAAHADEGLALLADPLPRESAILGCFTYSRNEAVLHTDADLMPRRRNTWSAWNYLGRTDPGGDRRLCVTYWMNRLQTIPHETPLFVTLNPITPPEARTILRTDVYHHPLFNAAALRAQKSLWSLQGEGGVWWCGAYFGSGFHEDGLQAGLAVAEAIGGRKRPWSVSGESDRIHLGVRSREAVAGAHAARP